MGRGVRGAAGRLLLEAAVVMERTVAGRRAAARWHRRRNAVLRAAGRLGVPVETLAARLGLSERRVRKVLHERRPPAPEEASGERAARGPVSAERVSTGQTATESASTGLASVGRAVAGPASAEALPESASAEQAATESASAGPDSAQEASAQAASAPEDSAGQAA
jgi:Mg-chelatase subunit ChlI